MRSSLLFVVVAVLTLLLVAPDAAAQCTCDRVVPCGLMTASKWLNENGQDLTAVVGPGVNGAHSHANLFVFTGGALVTHVCFSPRRTGDPFRIHLKGDAGGMPGVAIFSTPTLVTDLSADPIFGRLELVEVDPLSSGVAVAGPVWVEVEYTASSAGLYQGVRARTSAAGTCMVKQSGGAWTDYDSTGVAEYIGHAPIIRALHLVSVTREVRVTPVAGVTSSEAGGTAQLRVELVGPAPTSDVAVDLVSSNVCEGVAFPRRVVFPAGSTGGSIPALAVGIDDPICDRHQPYTIAGIASSGDPCWNGATGPPAPLVNADDDSYAFASPVLRSVGDQPRDVVVAELTGDGEFDVATANSASGDVTLLTNDGTGSLSAPVSIAVGGSPAVLAAGDVDGDFDADIVVIDETTGNLGVLVNDGAGTFTPSIGRGRFIGRTPRRVLLVDMDRDNDLDLVAAVDGGVAVSLNSGTGGFGAPAYFAAGHDVTDIAVDYFDADFYPDVAAAAQALQSIAVFANDGAGGLVPAGLCATGNAAMLTGVAAGDLDTDGDVDLLASTSGGLDSLADCRNAGGGTFGSGGNHLLPSGSDPRDVLVAYFGASRPFAAVALGATSRVFLVDVSAPALLASVQLAAPPDRLATADLDRDGLLDLVAVHGAQDAVSVLLTRCSRPAAPPLQFFGPSPGTAPGDNEFLVATVSPGAMVRFAASLRAGSTAVCPGLSFDLRNAKILRDVLSEPCGTAPLTFRVPARARGKTVLFQAADLQACRKTAVVTYSFP